MAVLPGKFITLEGVDGAGKSSHIDYIKDTLAAGGRHVIVTREPGGTELAEHLRKSILHDPLEPVTETLMVLVARADHVRRVIAPAIAAGTWVVCDRFTDATFAYQCAGKGVSATLVSQLSDAVHPGVRPDRTLLFDVGYEIARERLAGTGKALDRFEREAREFFERVRGAYLARAKFEPERVRVIDAGGEFQSVRRAVGECLAF